MDLNNDQNKPPSILTTGLQFLADITKIRLQHFVSPEQVIQMPEFIFCDDGSPLATFIIENKLTIEELLLVMMVLAPHVHPNFYGSIIAEVLPAGSELPEFGGIKPNQLRNLLPTGETALFILAGMELSERLRCTAFFKEDEVLFHKKVLGLDTPNDGEPLYSGKLFMFHDWIERFIHGTVSLPKFSTRFPAQHLNSELNWEDLVLPEITLNQLKEISIWIEHHQTLANEWGMGKQIKSGYRALFYGPAGTGKTLAAQLLGKKTNKQVFRIDLAALVSKFIGETEKNLSYLFDQAENKNWILFFDEADAIFGKRTQVRDAHDKYANQEVSYLLQRIEAFAGLVILATNFRSNIDEAMTRRFQSIIFFSIPRAQERLTLWQKNLPAVVQLDSQINLEQIASTYELTGSNIVNIIQYCCLQALEANTTLLSYPNLISGINRELRKENRSA